MYIDDKALISNVACIRRYAPDAKVIAMVKANAYGCGLSLVLPILELLVDGFGVACIEEAVEVRKLCPDIDCILFQGVFNLSELLTAEAMNLTIVIHNAQILEWCTTTALPKKLHVWIKVDTGMHRLGFAPEEVDGVLNTLQACDWIADDIGLMTHMASADQPDSSSFTTQLDLWVKMSHRYSYLRQSVANSASIIHFPQLHASSVRPGIMMYGASPLADKIGVELGVAPVMHFVSTITTIHYFETGDCIGYNASWQCMRPTVIGVIPVGYGDGYPRHILENTPTWVNGKLAPIVGRVSMDMMTIDLTDCPNVSLGDTVELWGQHVPIEVVAKQANTIAYELMSQVSQRVRREYIPSTNEASVFNDS